MNKKIPPYYKPTVKSASDTSNFASYPESDTSPPALKPAEDPFLDWWMEYKNLLAIFRNFYLIIIKIIIIIIIKSKIKICNF